jgi:hypothetical protein
MSVSQTFAEVARRAPSLQAKQKKQSKRLAPFSVRLTEAERNQLTAEARGLPLGTFIKRKALGNTPGTSFPRAHSSAFVIADRESLAKALALLGASRIANNLNQLAYCANIGTLPLTPEVEHDLLESLSHVREIRRLLISALGKTGGGKP